MRKTFAASVVAALWGFMSWTVAVPNAQQVGGAKDLKSPSFEVASVKRNTDGGGNTTMGIRT